MSADTWYSDAPPPQHGDFRFADWLRIVRRAIPLALLVFGGLLVTLILRILERPLFGLHRPWTAPITVAVCRSALWILGLRHQVAGQPMQGPGAMVANHASWLDIFVLNALDRLYFVSKAEVSAWPGIGWLARATGTLFIARNRSEARGHVALVQERLNAGHRLLFFPEGTSSDGQSILPFKPTLFAAFFGPDVAQDLQIQPITVRYMAPDGADPRLYGWWGDMDFAPHLLTTLATQRQGKVKVTLHPPVKVQDYGDRKRLAKTLETQVRAGLGRDRST